MGPAPAARHPQTASRLLSKQVQKTLGPQTQPQPPCLSGSCVEGTGCHWDESGGSLKNGTVSARTLLQGVAWRFWGETGPYVSKPF